MSSTTRAPAGYYQNGGLAGWASSPTVGLVGPAGLHLHEDWLAYTSGGTTRYGEIGWQKSNISGGGATAIMQTPGAVTEVGVIGLRSGTQANRGATLNTNAIGQLYSPPIGMVWATKLDMSSTNNIEVWSGFADSASGRVRTSDGTGFVGVRYLSTVGSWEGVVKDGSGSADETVVTIGSHSAGTYQVLGFEVVDTDGAGTAGVQFFTLACSERRQWVRTDHGSPITANIPTNTGMIAAGVITLSAAQRIVQQDFYTIGGRVAR
jgi:hypothetical protein